jgi:hypothetical protein
MLHNFPYDIETHVDHGAAFPGIDTTKRPILAVMLRSSIAQAPCEALVDSGADYCLFPWYLIKDLGLRMADATPISGIFGYGDSSDAAIPFWRLDLDVMAPPAAGQLWPTTSFSIRTTIGFSAKQDRMGFGLLGQLGFFSEVAQVHFDYKAGWFRIDAVDL